MPDIGDMTVCMSPADRVDNVYRKKITHLFPEMTGMFPELPLQQSFRQVSVLRVAGLYYTDMISLVVVAIFDKCISTA